MPSLVRRGLAAEVVSGQRKQEKNYDRLREQLDILGNREKDNVLREVVERHVRELNLQQHEDFDALKKEFEALLADTHGRV